MKRKLTIIHEKLKSGDESFYKSLFDDYYLPLTYYSFKITNNIEASKEIVQDLFVKLFEKRHSIQIEVSLKSYLYRSVYNSSLNYLQSMSIREHHSKILKTEISEYELYSDEEINQTELEYKIYTEIEKLPLQCKKIFKMNRFEGFSNSEIAGQLNLSKRTVETQISKALKILRKKLSRSLVSFML